MLPSLESINLKKWCGFLVRGKSVSKNQAAEILIRTDSNQFDFRYAGNSEKNRTELKKYFGYNFKEDEPNCYNKQLEIINNLRMQFGVLDLNYLTNSRIVTPFIQGPYGWCDWDGSIGCNSYNVGRWPSADGLYEEWKLIAECFPFLELRCQILQDEIGIDNPTPVLEFLVKEGNVEVRTEDLILQEKPAKDSEKYLYTLAYMTDAERESGISIKELHEKLSLVHEYLNVDTKTVNMNFAQTQEEGLREIDNARWRRIIDDHNVNYWVLNLHNRQGCRIQFTMNLRANYCDRGHVQVFTMGPIGLDGQDMFPRFFMSAAEADKHVRDFAKWRIWKYRVYDHSIRTCQKCGHILQSKRNSDNLWECETCIKESQ